MKRFNHCSRWEHNSPSEPYGCGMPIVTSIILALFLICSCATKTKIEYVDREVIKYVTKIQHDTLVHDVHDSVFYAIIQKGDTVFKLKYVYKTEYRDRVVVKVDTVRKDSIEKQVVTETKEVVKTKRPWWAWMCLAFTLATLGLIVYNVYKWFKK